MPTLRGLIPQDGHSEPLCCCEENECKAGLEPLGAILWVNAEEVIHDKPHCDCIYIRLRPDNTLEVYSIELKNIRKPKDQEDKAKLMQELRNEVLDVNRLSQKCQSCLHKAQEIIGKIDITTNPLQVSRYCVIVIPLHILTVAGALLQHLTTTISAWKNKCDKAWLTYCGAKVSTEVYKLYHR